LDERHRIVASGVFDLPWDFQLAPILQYASSRPYSLNLGLDIDGDGLATNDRICEGTDPAAVFAARGNTGLLGTLNPNGCRQVQVNSVREGFITDITDPTRPIIGTGSGRYFNVDLRAQKAFRLGERFSIKAYADFYNIFNTEKLLGAPPRVAITDKSGADGVVHWINEFFGLKDDERINKIKVHKLARWVIDQYEVEGRLTTISDQELAAKAKEFFPEYWTKYKAGK